MSNNELPEYDPEAYSPSPKPILCCGGLKILSRPANNNAQYDIYFQPLRDKSGIKPLPDEYDLALEWDGSYLKSYLSRQFRKPGAKT